MSINRRELISRYHVRLSGFCPDSPLSVGNGQFAFTADVTGLQTFPDVHTGPRAVPLCTMSQWGWHSFPSDATAIRPRIEHQGLALEEFPFRGRTIRLATSENQPPANAATFQSLRQNPHRFQLARVGLCLRHDNASHTQAHQMRSAQATLNLWEGAIHSSFAAGGLPVSVDTGSIGDIDGFATRVASSGISSRRVTVRVSFPYASHGITGANWDRDSGHCTELVRLDRCHWLWIRKMDNTTYHVTLRCGESCVVSRVGHHEFEITGGQECIECVFRFSPRNEPEVPQFAEAWRIGRRWWERYWSGGAVVEISSPDPKHGAELERRVVLSQYLMAVNCAGSLPPAETGLTCNSWNGKFHLEMHWWHGVHWYAWGRFAQLEKSFEWYRRTLMSARERAGRQGFHRGARWPKMTSCDGHDAPSSIGPLLIWQQPHIIYFAELSYRQRPTRETLEYWAELVFASADWMAEFASQGVGQIGLGPPLKTVSENTIAPETRNPTFELHYWRLGLTWAQRWRARMDLGPDGRWASVLADLPALPMHEGRYLLQEGMTDTYSKWCWEHPAMLGICGMLPGDGVDAAVFRRTIETASAVWNWDSCWGWDFPLAAMAATRAGLPQLAVEHLLRLCPKNTFSTSGHNFQNDDLPVYLPGNGGLLVAVALLAVGWDSRANAPEQPAGWEFRSEGLARIP